MSKRKLPPDKEVIGLYLSGESTVLIAAKFNASSAAVSGCLKRNGYEARSRESAMALAFSTGRLKSPAKTHGLSKTSEFMIWMSMRARCSNPKSKDWPLYGGRGIRVCERWQKSFVEFLGDMGSRPSPLHSIDRIKVDGNYDPQNCRWATQSEQSQNRRTNRMLTFGGRTLSLTEWSRKLGLKKSVLKSRLASGWSVEDALTRPIDSRRITQEGRG